MFPFFLVFRVVELASIVVRFGQGATTLARSTKLSRFLAPLLKTPRFFETFPRMLHFFEKPTGDHYSHEKR